MWCGLEIKSRILVLGLRISPFPYLFGILGICIAALIGNFIWFFVAFRASKKPSTIHNN
ncbi:DUF5391 family protein [Sporosarcina limicola]|uniref:DUF5391 family protein n=1 Tax=Sporosarcina limicola TaxID=34101 RepID=UPI001CEF0512